MNSVHEKNSWQQLLDQSTWSGFGFHAFQALETLNRSKPFALICYADVLGYRALLERLGVRKLHALLGSALDQLNVSITDENISRIGGDRHTNPIRFITNLELAGEIGAFFAFDTFIFYIQNLTYDNLKEGIGRFLAFCSRVYLRLLIESGILLRGLVAVSQDYMIEGPRITLQEIDKLYRIEKALAFGGVVVAIPYLQLLPSWSNSRWGMDSATYRHVPCKDRERFLPVLNLGFDHTVRWLRREGLSLSIAGKRLEEESVLAEEEDAKAKILNTIAYLRWCIHDQYVMRCPPFATDPRLTQGDMPIFDEDTIVWANKGLMPNTFRG